MQKSSKMKGIKSTLTMNTEQRIELLNHCIIPLKLMQHRMLTIPEFLKKQQDWSNVTMLKWKTSFHKKETTKKWKHSYRLEENRTDKGPAFRHALLSIALRHVVPEQLKCGWHELIFTVSIKCPANFKGFISNFVFYFRYFWRIINQVK